MIIVNARFLTQNITGVQRFAIEISQYLKKLYSNDIQFLAPKNIVHLDLAKNLDTKIIGNNTGHLWEQYDLPKYLKQKNNPLLINLANTAPIGYRNKITTIHDIAFIRFPQTFNWKFRYFYKITIPYIINSSKHILTVSEFSKKEIIDFYKIQNKNISVIYNSPSDIFKNETYDYEDKYILAVSSINFQKNFHSLIKAFNLIKNKNIKLYLVGDINKNFANNELINLIKSNQNIIFKGHVNDNELVKLYSNAICFIYPSLYEGFGIPPLEAQACGTPVICSHIASLPEVCLDSALYCDPYSIEDITKKIDLLIEDKNLQKKLINKGYKNIKRFSWKKSAMKIVKVIEEQI